LNGSFPFASMMNYPVWPDSAGVAGYSRTLLGQGGGGMRSSLAPPPPPPPPAPTQPGSAGTGGADEGGNNTNKCNPPKYNVTNGGTDPTTIQRSANHHSSSSAAGGSSSSSAARLNNGDDCGSGGGGGSGGGARGHQLPSADKYAPLSSFTDDDSLLKVNSIGSGLNTEISFFYFLIKLESKLPRNTPSKIITNYSPRLLPPSVNYSGIDNEKQKESRQNLHLFGISRNPLS
jgi:hypothetical protein